MELEAIILSIVLIWIDVPLPANAQFSRHKSATNHCWQQKALVQPDLEWIEEAVERHNYHRSFHGAPPLALNLQLCQISQAWANERARGVEGHNPKRCRLGENIHTAWSSGELGYRNASIVVDDWYNEEEFYDYSTGRLKSGHPNPNHPVGHFTQVVWNSTAEMGIGATKYFKRHADGTNFEYLVVVANYYPPGNSPKFLENVAARSSSSRTMVCSFSDAGIDIGIHFLFVASQTYFMVGREYRL